MSGLAQFLLLGPFFHEGQLVPSPKLYHYLPGTTQEKTAWMDRGKAITAANPIEGDANGLVYGYFSGVYKLVIKTRDGSVTRARIVFAVRAASAMAPVLKCTTGAEPRPTAESDSRVIVSDVSVLKAWIVCTTRYS